jgi:translocation and assembly module TamB
MSKRRKVLLSAGGILLVLAMAAILVLRSAWFANFVREKVISTVEDSTGGVVEIASFQFDWSRLTVRIRGFVLHGNEARNADPLLSAASLELRLKLFSRSKAVDLEYLGIQNPRANLMVYPDGTTNLPQPKIVKKPSGTSGLETVVNLAVHRFEINNGLLQYSQKKVAFSGRGEHLRVLLNYNVGNPRYSGSVSIDPLRLTSGSNPPLDIRIAVPLTIEKDAITVTDASFNSTQSTVLLNGSLRDLNAPVIETRLQTSVSLPEMRRSFGLPIAVQGSVPGVMIADLSARMDRKNNRLEVQRAHLALGQTNFEASGVLGPGNNAIQFTGNLALAELSRLAELTSPRVTGELQLNGSAKLDVQNNYEVDGMLNSRGVSLHADAVQVPSFNLHSPFHADAHLISMGGLQVNTLGGNISAKISLENLKQLNLSGNLRNMPLTALAIAFVGKPLGYGGSINGPFIVKGDLQAHGTSGYQAQTHLHIAPGQTGVPLSGQLNASYEGGSGALDIRHSFLTLPHSRLNLSGSFNKELDVQLRSRNLNDFLPAANLGAAKPIGDFPIALNGGVATLQAKVTGKLASPHIESHLEMGPFSAQNRIFDRLALNVAASPSGVAVQDGQLKGKTLESDFSGSIGLRQWRPLPDSAVSAGLRMRNADVADLLSLAGETSIPASGQLTADVTINGTYGNPLGGATLQIVNGSAYHQPFQRLRSDVSLTDQLITLSNLEFDAAGGQVKLDGTFQHPRDSFTVGHAQFRVSTNPLQLADLAAIQHQNLGISGALQLTANASADVSKANGETAVSVSNVTADLSARSLRVRNEPAGDLTAKARTMGGIVHYDLTSDFAGSNVRADGKTALTKNYPTTAHASIQRLSVEKTLALAGQADIPARGDLSAEAQVTGPLNAPDASLNFNLSRANLYSEPVSRLRGSFHYSNAIVEIPSVQLETPAGSVSVTGLFSHPAGDLNQGSLKLSVNSSSLQLAKIEHVRAIEPDLAGTLHLAVDISAELNNRRLLISALTADASAAALRLDRRDLGSATFTAKTAKTTGGSNLEFRLDSNIAGSQIHGSGQSRLVRGYPLRASLTFANIRYSNLAPLLSLGTDLNPRFDALVEGKGSIDGSLLDPKTLSGRLQLDRLQAGNHQYVSPSGAAVTRAVQFENNAPIVATLQNGVVRLQPLRIEGPRSFLTASGEVDFNGAKTPLKLAVDANADLGALQDLDHDFYSSGGVLMNVAVRGSLDKPVVNGQMELKNANINYAGSPNGLENGNGVIVLNGSTATIQNLTGESGGGKISLTGFVGFGASRLSYNLRAAANKVRVRYQNISLTSNANLSLTGNNRRSLLGGTITVNRLAYSSSSDIGSILSTTSAPPAGSGAAPSSFLTGVRLDVQVVTAPDLRVVTTYAERLEVFSSLSVRGTLASPGIIGRVDVTNGQLVFFGNTYNVNSGSIDFYDPNAIEPVLNVSLETNAQGVDVTIGVTGPMSDLKLSYRSDPPLTFEQIVQLLATNTTPANATIAAHQPTPPQQSASQMGESAILGQAVANPLASRVQRVFGLTQFKIDPTFAGNNGLPSARVTLQQKIASNITFTYTTDVTQSNSELVRVQWDFSSAFSAVALRDFNGNTSLEFYYKFKKR